MGQFAAALKNAMDQMGWDQLDLVGKLEKVSQSSLSRYLISNDLPKATTIELICKNLPEELCDDVAAAYLTDQIPPSASGRVVVTTVKNDGNNPPRYIPGKAAPGSDLQRDLEDLGRCALEDPNVAMAIGYLAASFRGSMPPQHYSKDLEDWDVDNDPAVVAARKNLAEQKRQGEGHGSQGEGHGS